MKTFSWDSPPNLEAAYLTSEDIEECAYPAGKADGLEDLRALLKNHQEAIDAAGDWIDEAVERAAEVHVLEMLAALMPTVAWDSLCFAAGRDDAALKKILRDWLNE
jgi:hypothetical protein